MAENLSDNQFYLVPVTPLPNLMHWCVLDILDAWVHIKFEEPARLSGAMFEDINRIMQTSLSLKSYPFIKVKSLNILLRFHGVANVVDDQKTIDAMAECEVVYFDHVMDGLKMWTQYKRDFLGMLLYIF